MPITITVSDGSSSKGLRLSKELVELFELDTDSTRVLIRGCLISRLYSPAQVSDLIQGGIEEID